MNEAVAEVAQKVANNRPKGPRRRCGFKISCAFHRCPPSTGRDAWGSSRPRAAMRASYTATRAATAANESWKLAPMIASGWIRMTSAAASARLRIVNACLSSTTEVSMIKVMNKARSVPTREPVAMS
jgi:hypothetical protein